jgi:hypothetical protein
MIRFAATATAILALTILPASAQRTASHAASGFSGHAASGFSGHPSGNFSARTSGFTSRSAPAFRPSFSISPAYRSTRTPIAAVPYTQRPTFYNRYNRGTQPARYYRRPTYRNTVPYAGVYPSSVWLDPYGFDDLGYPPAYDTATIQPPYADPNYGPNYAQSYDPSYNTQPVPQPAQTYTRLPQPPPTPEDAVTIIFKDGRPPEQIHNYALTRTMLYVRDRHHADIPVDQIDLAATKKANQDSGADFALPVPTN